MLGHVAMGVETPSPEFFMVELRASDWERLWAWYRDVLGLRVALMDLPGRFALLEAGPCRIAIKAGAVEGVRSGVRLVFRVDDLEGEVARLRALGVELSGPLDVAVERYREVRLTDPEGTPITLFAWMRDLNEGGSTGTTD